MAEIKISELSIGDWVEMGGKNFQIYHLTLAGDVYGYRRTNDSDTGEEYYDGEIGDVYPIPLTPEILKKSGWECIAVGDNGPATPKEHYNRYEKWRCETKWGYRDLFFDRMTKRWRLSGMNCTTFTELHKLQHALRISGFEKEIEL